MSRKTGAVPARKKSKMRTSNWQFWAIIALPVIYAIVFAYIPMGGIVIAFKDYSIRKGIFGSDWVGLKYFKQFLTSTSSVTVIKNTVILGIYTLVVNFPIPILLAIGINEIRNKTYKKTIQMITYAPYFISVVVLVGMMMQMMDLRSGVINMILQKLGMNPINFFGDAGLFRSLYVWSGVWQSIGWNSIIYFASLSNVDESLHEAAIVDGATILQRIRYIDLPSIRPVIVTLFIMNTGKLMSIGFEKAYLMQNSLNMDTSEIISTYVYKIGLLNQQYSYSTAINLFNSVINLILMFSVNTLSKKLSDTSIW